jgi:hypothetical protein
MLIFDGGSLVLAVAQWELVVNEFEVRWLIFEWDYLEVQAERSHVYHIPDFVGPVVPGLGVVAKIKNLLSIFTFCCGTLVPWALNPYGNTLPCASRA